MKIKRLTGRFPLLEAKKASIWGVAMVIKPAKWIKCHWCRVGIWPSFHKSTVNAVLVRKCPGWSASACVTAPGSDRGLSCRIDSARPSASPNWYPTGSVSARAVLLSIGEWEARDSLYAAVMIARTVTVRRRWISRRRAAGTCWQH